MDFRGGGASANGGVTEEDRRRGCMGFIRGRIGLLGLVVENSGGSDDTTMRDE